MKLRIYSLILSMVLAFGGLWLGSYLIYFFDSLALMLASFLTMLAFLALGVILFAFVISCSTKDWDSLTKDLFERDEVPK